MCGKTQATASGKRSANIHGYLIGSPPGPHIASNVWGTKFLKPPTLSKNGRKNRKRATAYFSKFGAWQNAVATVGFAPKFYAKWYGKELPISHGDYFRELFGFLLRGSVSGRSLWEVSGESLGGLNNY